MPGSRLGLINRLRIGPAATRSATPAYHRIVLGRRQAGVEFSEVMAAITVAAGRGSGMVPADWMQRHTPRLLDGADLLCAHLELARSRRPNRPSPR